MMSCGGTRLVRGVVVVSAQVGPAWHRRGPVTPAAARYCSRPGAQGRAVVMVAMLVIRVLV